MLKNAGLDEIHLQYDTFNDDVNLKIRGKHLNALKTETLDNLEKLNFSTDIVMTVLKCINESEIKDIFNFFRRKKIVKKYFLSDTDYSQIHTNDSQQA
jgi:uncharacterized radical SAM superfamily Fe-S cluster-containing enzyme